MNDYVEVEGIGSLRTTFKADAGIKAVVTVSGAAAVENMAVTVVGNSEVGLGSAGDPLRGILEKYEGDGFVTVQVKGFKENVPSVSGALPSVNDDVCVNGAGLVSGVASGYSSPAYAVSVDGTASVNTVTIFIG